MALLHDALALHPRMRDRRDGYAMDTDPFMESVEALEAARVHGSMDSHRRLKLASVALLPVQNGRFPRLRMTSRKVSSDVAGYPFQGLPHRLDLFNDLKHCSLPSGPISS